MLVPYAPGVGYCYQFRLGKGGYNSQMPIATPNFITHFQRQLLADEEITLWRQGEGVEIKLLSPRALWHPTTCGPTSQQYALLTRL
ncbi:MAG: hypothetical protein ACSLEN_11910 [Candidatus Malihini olakiniferum]